MCVTAAYKVDLTGDLIGEENVRNGLKGQAFGEKWRSSRSITATEAATAAVKVITVIIRNAKGWLMLRQQ